MRGRCLLVIVGLALPGLLTPSTATAQAQDSVTGSATGGSGFFGDIQIDVQSGPSGENPSGTAFFRIGGDQGDRLGGPVTCLAVEGNAATLVVEDTLLVFAHVAIEVVDNVATGTPDTFDSVPFRQPDDCSQISGVGLLTPIVSGDIVVVDAPAFPTTKDQCKNDGWRNFGGFKNQGDCVSFVATGGKNPPVG